MQRQDKEYYRSKTVHHEMYVRITQAMQLYLTDNALKMFSHGWSTQINEAMNKSVSLYDSLKARASVTCAIPVKGY